MTSQEYEERCAPIREMISMLRERHEKELKPWYDRLLSINTYYIPPISIQLETREMPPGVEKL